MSKANQNIPERRGGLIGCLARLVLGEPIRYTGFHCGCCGAWVDKVYTINSRKSDGPYWDTVGVCEECVFSENNED